MTTKHLSITLGLQLLAPHAIDSTVTCRGYCNGTLDCLWPFFFCCFPDLDIVNDFVFLNNKKLVKVMMFAGHALFFLNNKCVLSFWNVLFPWLHFSNGFCKHSREQYEKLSTMHKNMQKLYESIGNYFAFDPHAVSVEDFFGELASFRILFMVSVKLCFMSHDEDQFHVSCSVSVDTRRAADATTHTCSCTHLHTVNWVSVKWEQHIHTFSSSFH